MKDDTMGNVYVFDNGVRVYKEYLLKAQIDRYRIINLHEPEEEKWFTEAITTLPKNGVFVDIGAAIGYYVILAKQIAPNLEIHAFEPLATFRDAIRANMSLNFLSMKGIIIHPEAISSQVRVAKFHVNAYGSSLVSDEPLPYIDLVNKLKKRLLGRCPSSYISVPTITLDGFVTSLTKSIGLIKVDVQGFELEVLNGAKKACQEGLIKQWLIGTHGEKRHKAALVFLREHGYTVIFEQQKVQHQPDGIIYAKLIEP